MILLLVVSGTLEAFVSPSGMPGGVKIAIGLTVGACFYSWMLLAGRKRRPLPRLALDGPAADLLPEGRVALSG